LGKKRTLRGSPARPNGVGATKVYVEDLREDFVRDFVFPAVRANAVYEGGY